MMSGIMLNQWAFESDAIRYTYELLRTLNIQNSTHVIDELKTVDAYDFIPPVYTNVLQIDFFGSVQVCFVPTIDEEFVIQSPHILTQQNPVSNVPIMIGMTNREFEWMLSYETSTIRYPNKNLNITSSITDFIVQFFEHDFDDKQRFMQIFHQTAEISYAIYNFIERYVDITKQKRAFLYIFGFDGKLSKFKGTRETTDVTGAAHGDDLGYLFKDYFQGHGTPNNVMNLTNELITRERMVTMWTNFIKFG